MVVAAGSGRFLKATKIKGQSLYVRGTVPFILAALTKASRMTQEILDGVHLRTEYIQSLINPFRIDPANPASALDVYEAVQSCSRIRDYLGHTSDLLFKEAFANRISDYNAEGHSYIRALRWAMRAMDAVEKVICERKLDDLLRDLRQARNDVQSSIDDFTRQWPWIDHALLAESIAMDQQGGRRPLKTAFDEIRNRTRKTG